MQVLKYTEIIQQYLTQSMYMLDIVLPQLMDTISHAKATQSTLINVYRDAYYDSIYKELDSQKQVFELHIGNLETIYSEYNSEIETIETIVFDEEIKMFEHKLIVTITKLKTLVRKMEIELKKIKGKTDETVSK